MPYTRDPNACRRALREISEIAAVAVLQDSQLEDQEALQMIAAIAQWMREEDPAAGAECGDVIRRLNDMTTRVDFEALDDQQAVALFARVLEALRG